MSHSGSLLRKLAVVGILALLILFACRTAAEDGSSTTAASQNSKPADSTTESPNAPGSTTESPNAPGSTTESPNAPASSTTTDAPSNSVSNSGDSPSSGTPCTVEHCAECVAENPKECKSCSKDYVLTDEKVCKEGVLGSAPVLFSAAFAAVIGAAVLVF